MRRKEISGTSARHDMLKELQALAARSTLVAQGSGSYWNQDITIKVLYDTITKQYLTAQVRTDKSELAKGLPFMLIARRGSNEGTKLVIGQKTQENVFMPMGIAAPKNDGLSIEINAAGTHIHCAPTDLGIALLRNLARPIEPNEKLLEIKRNRYANHEEMLAKAKESLLFTNDDSNRLDLVYHEKNGDFIVVLRRGAIENSHIMETQHVMHGRIPRLLFGPRNAEKTFLPLGHAILFGNTIQVHFADGREFSLPVDPKDARIAHLLPAHPPKLQIKHTNATNRINPLLTSTSHYISKSERALLNSAMDNPTDESDDELTPNDLARLRGESPIHIPVYERQRG